mmetsp:Transcript_41207/g.106616  ORF Transcript_41207/g.106616 Transcript_41207/m.106616 type:complete len:472 (-) Transcript_41207:189-1604(-)
MASAGGAGAWRPRRSPIPIRASDVRGRRGDAAEPAAPSLPPGLTAAGSAARGPAAAPAAKDMEPSTAAVAVGNAPEGPAALSRPALVPGPPPPARAPAMAAVAGPSQRWPPSAAVMLPLAAVAAVASLDCATPKRLPNEVSDCVENRRLGFGETPLKQMPTITPVSKNPSASPAERLSADQSVKAASARSPGQSRQGTRRASTPPAFQALADVAAYASAEGSASTRTSRTLLFGSSGGGTAALEVGRTASWKGSDATTSSSHGTSQAEPSSSPSGSQHGTLGQPLPCRTDFMSLDVSPACLVGFEKEQAPAPARPSAGGPSRTAVRVARVASPPAATLKEHGTFASCVAAAGPRARSPRSSCVPRLGVQGRRAAGTGGASGTTFSKSVSRRRSPSPTAPRAASPRPAAPAVLGARAAAAALPRTSATVRTTTSPPPAPVIVPRVGSPPLAPVVAKLCGSGGQAVPPSFGGA